MIRRFPTAAETCHFFEHASFETMYLGPGGGDESTISSTSRRTLQAAFIVYVGAQRLEIQAQDFLEVCWKGGFESPCSICDNDFEIVRAPPVRTLCLPQSLQEANLTGTMHPAVVIVNTHLECLKLRRVKYIPISHTWHQPIAEAYASRVSNPTATSMIFEMPFRILLAVVQRFGPDVHIWHDYMSIPQWQDSFRGTTILPQIFEIFRHGYCSIIHLDEQSPIRTLQTYTPEDFVTESLSLQRLFRARWFTRMWPVVEYHVGGDAYLLNSNYEIMPDTFSSLMKQIADYYVSCPTPDCTLLTSTNGVSSKWFQDLPLFIRERTASNLRCLGVVYDMIGNQGCRSLRDRFIASCALLDINDKSDISWQLPEDPQEACLWVSKRSLEGNDFSPILLRFSQEPQYDAARWLKAHTIMTADMWGLGVQTQPAITPPFLQGNRVQLELQCLGTVRKAFDWKIDGANDHFGFMEVLPFLVDVAVGSASRFFQFVERLYPSGFFWVRDGHDYKFPARRYQIPLLDSIENKLQSFLDRYSEVHRTDDTVQCKNFGREIIDILALEVPPRLRDQSYYGNMGRLQLCAALCASTENTLVVAECERCLLKTPFRVTMWRKPKSHARLYHIPGLSYMSSVPAGMGIVVEDEEVIGRMRYGLPTCQCNPRTLLHLS